MVRLYDPTQGKIFLEGKDIQCYTPQERTQMMGFILQEPFLFTGTVKENILYGNEQYLTYSDIQIQQILEQK